MSAIRSALDTIGFVIEVIGVAAIAVGFVLAAIWFAGRLRRDDPSEAYRHLRRDLGRSILLGLEFLVAGDIIRTVTVEPTLSGVATLAIIVAIRVVLSLTLEVELDGRWPWRRNQAQNG